MSRVDGFGVAVTVSLADPLPPAPSGSLPAGVSRRRTRLSEVLEPGLFSDAGLAGELQTIGDARAQLAAYEAVVVAELARRRPVESDLTDGLPGHAVEGWVPDRVPVGVSEFLADELALVTGVSRTAATVLAERSLVWVRELPATWAALADGLVDEARATAIARALGGQSSEAGGPVQPALVAEVEAQALGWARAGETPVRLRERTAAALIALDEAAADRRRKKAERCADVTVRPTADGMSELVAELPTPLAAACREAVNSYAAMAKDDGDHRPIGQLRAQVLADLVLRPWDTSREPVTAHLTVLAPLPVLGDRAGDRFRPGMPAPGQTSPHDAEGGTPGAGWSTPTDEDAVRVEGAPITAGQLRELLAQLDAVCPGGLQVPTGGSLNVALLDPHTGALRATVSRPALERLARRGCPAHRRPAERPTGPDQRRGAGRPPAPPTNACRCAVLDRPPPIDRYTPTPAQRRFAQARDRTCRHPGCRRPAARTDLDHVQPHATGGATDCTNLCCLCRRHHRLKTHAPGWRFTMTADGVLSVTTPSGVTRTTWPPGIHLARAAAVADPTGPRDGPVRPHPSAHQLAGIGSPVPADDPPPF